MPFSGETILICGALSGVCMSSVIVGIGVEEASWKSG